MAVSDVTAIYSGTICFAQILQATRENDLSLANIEAWLLDFFFYGITKSTAQRQGCRRTAKYDIKLLHRSGHISVEFHLFII